MFNSTVPYYYVIIALMGGKKNQNDYLWRISLVPSILFFFSKKKVLPRGEQKIAHRVYIEGTVLYGELK